MITSAGRASKEPSVEKVFLQIPVMPARPFVTLGVQHHQVFSEETFQGILCWERKKAERSSQRLLLMTVTLEDALEQAVRESTLSEIETVLCESTRETDATGWYSKGAVLGIILTDLNEGNAEALAELVRTRITDALEDRIPEQLKRVRISFHSFPNNWMKSGLGRANVVSLYPDLLKADRARRLFRFAKRTIDICGSAAALVFCLPLLALISLLIKLTSRGPVLFKQERIGRYGVPFTFLKFRSMRCGNDPRIHQEYVARFIAGEVKSPANRTEKAVYKIQDDPRVTGIGRLLRKTSLDELPQLFNVLKGEMSLVGPRPPIRYELEAYKVWHRRRVLEVKPGITGLWQVSGRSKTTFDEMVRLDLRYARTWSPWLDLKILLRTPWAVFSGEGAY